MLKLLSSNKKSLILIFIALVVIIFAIFSNYGLLKRLNIIEKQQKLETTIKNYNNEIDSLNKRLEILTNDDFELEKLAREKFGLIKPGEKIYFVEQKNKTGK